MKRTDKLQRFETSAVLVANIIPPPTVADIHFLVRELGSHAAALTYCERIAAVNGPLAWWYSRAADYIRPLAQPPARQEER